MILSVFLEKMMILFTINHLFAQTLMVFGYFILFNGIPTLDRVFDAKCWIYM